MADVDGFGRPMQAHGRAWLLAVASLTASSIATLATAAPEQGPIGVEELIVTAQKRPENIQDVPLSIMAVSESALAARGVEDARGLERIVPGLRLEHVVQVAGIAIRIRGFGALSSTAIDPSVAPYIDDVYIPRPGAILSTFLDVETIEVLRGPQGTLFGRNATAGALSIRTRAPDPSGAAGRVAGQIGRFGERQADGFVNLPLTDDFAVRVALLANESDGYVKSHLTPRTYGRKDLAEGRLSALWKISDDITWIGRVDYAHTTGDGASLNQVDTSTASAGQLAALAARLGGVNQVFEYPPSYTVSHALTNLDLSDRQYGVTSDLSYVGPWGVKLRLINAYRDWRHEQNDGDGIFTPLDLLNREGVFDSGSRSHELQVISPPDALLGGRLEFVAGVYRFEEDSAIGE
jgi:iron complex outermembrane recepter protein